MRPRAAGCNPKEQRETPLGGQFVSGTLRRWVSGISSKSQETVRLADKKSNMTNQGSSKSSISLARQRRHPSTLWPIINRRRLRNDHCNGGMVMNGASVSFCGVNNEFRAQLGFRYRCNDYVCLRDREETSHEPVGTSKVEPFCALAHYTCRGRPRLSKVG